MNTGQWTDGPSNLFLFGATVWTVWLVFLHARGHRKRDSLLLRLFLLWFVALFLVSFLQVYAQSL